MSNAVQADRARASGCRGVPAATTAAALAVGLAAAAAVYHKVEAAAPPSQPQAGQAGQCTAESELGACGVEGEPAVPAEVLLQFPATERDPQLSYPRYFNVSRQRGARVWSAKELSLHDGNNKGLPLLLCMVGEVFDVATGDKFYAPPGGGYRGFSGRDGSRAMATGEFNETGLRPDIADLKLEDLGAVMEWREFYRTHKTYRFVGFLEGLYFDAAGEPTHELRKVEELYDTQQRGAELVKGLRKRFKACNQRNKQKDPHVEIWCDDKYHGPGGLPVHLYYTVPGKGEEDKGYCACVSPHDREAAEAEMLELKRSKRPEQLAFRFEELPDCPRGEQKCYQPKKSASK